MLDNDDLQVEFVTLTQMITELVQAIELPMAAADAAIESRILMLLHMAAVVSRSAESLSTASGGASDTCRSDMLVIAELMAGLGGRRDRLEVVARRQHGLVRVRGSPHIERQRHELGVSCHQSRRVVGKGKTMVVLGQVNVSQKVGGDGEVIWVVHTQSKPKFIPGI